MELKDFIKTYDGVLSDEQCDQVIELFESNSDHVIRYENSTRKLDQLWFHDAGLEFLQSDFARLLVPYIKEYFKSLNLSDFIGVQQFEAVRIKKYYKNGIDEFKEHIDATNLTNCKRYLVCIIYLNDNDGYTDFPQIGVKCEPKKGRLALFPPTWQFVHAGRTPTTDDKYLIMTYLNFLPEKENN